MAKPLLDRAAERLVGRDIRPIFLRVARYEAAELVDHTGTTLVACLLITRPWLWPVWWAAKRNVRAWARGLETAR